MERKLNEIPGKDDLNTLSIKLSRNLAHLELTGEKVREEFHGVPQLRESSNSCNDI